MDSDFSRLLASKARYIEKIRTSIMTLEDTKKKLDAKILPCKTFNTLGNVASIIGTGLLFTPLFFVGLGTTAVGAATSIGSSFAESSIDSSFREIITAVLNEEQKAEKEYFTILEELRNRAPAAVPRKGQAAKTHHSKAGVEIASGSSKSVLVALKVSDLKRMHDVGSGYKVAYNGVNGYANAIKAGTKMSAAGKILGGVGVVLSVADIVMTWGIDNETSKAILEFIKERQAKLIEQEEELKALSKQGKL